MKKAPQEDKKGLGQVMPETMLFATKLGTNIGGIIEDVSTVTGGAVARTVNDLKSKPLVTSDQAQTAGRSWGHFVGSIFNTIINMAAVFSANTFGAHKCDSCQTKNLYEYFTCQSCRPQFDLCKSCYAQVLSNKPLQDGHVIHQPDHSFKQHDSAMEFLKYLVILVVAGGIFRFLFRMFLWI